jgi:hypothetical protein
MDRGSFLYRADGALRVRPVGDEPHDAQGREWREAGLALNPSLGNPVLTRFGPLPLPGAVLLVSPEER